jgi:pimeloyl-ACP methyl ester carboxylesterase
VAAPARPVLTHGQAEVNGVTLHVVTAGRGPPVLLVPGWPQSWYAWREVIPLLAAAGRTVHAVDPRGLGDSERPPGGYDLDTVAADLAALATQLAGTTPLDVVAHDVGTWIAHAWALNRPGQFGRLVLVDAAIPGVSLPPSGLPDAAANLKTWHFAFNRLPGLPELLITGREREFLAWLFASKSHDPALFGPGALDEYTRILAAPGAYAAGLEYYRTAFAPAGLARAAERARQPLRPPVLAVGGASGVGANLGDTLAAVSAAVTTVVIPDCGHYVPEERPAELVSAITQFWRAHPTDEICG